MKRLIRCRNHPRLTALLLAGVCIAALLGRFAPTPMAEAQSDSPDGEPYIVDAGRSPIPQPGETFDEPLPAPLLIRLSPIAPDRLPGRDRGSGPGGVEADVDTAPDAPRPVVEWDEAKDYVGDTIIVEGEIVDANNIGNLTFLNFHEDWRDKFYIVVFKQAYPGVPGGDPAKHYLDKTIRVTGRVDLHRDRPQMKVYDADQIEVVKDR
ncbi:MAG: hypothetical protein ACOC3G_05075 [Phycisphaeraceae bacterium]